MSVCFICSVATIADNSVMLKTTQCKKCKKDILNFSTPKSLYCKECSKKLKVCEKCGWELEE